MNKAQREKLIGIATQLITEANEVVASRFDTEVIGAPTYVDSQRLHRWWGKVRSFGHQLGIAARPWQESLTTDPERNTLGFTTRLLGTLEAILHELKSGHLDTFTELVRAETYADLLDQSEHLFDCGYHLAAGVIARAVLEQHLRGVCATLACTPEKQRPIINDYNQAFYNRQHYNKVKMKQIDVLASIGNEAAHGNDSLDPEDVKKLISDLPEVMESTRV